MIVVPLLDLKAQYAQIRAEVLPVIEQVCASQRFILGDEVLGLEDEVARYCASAAGIGVSSGTDALLLALMALRIGAGDEVITSPYTFFATAGTIARLGARPVFCDIDPATFNFSPAAVQDFIDRQCVIKAGQLVNRSTGGAVKALMPVHLYGQSADMDPLMALAKQYRLKVIEDAAQAIGTEYKNGVRVGAIGDIGCFSFFPTKNLGAFGDAGLCTTNDADLAESMRVLRVHGGKPKYFHSVIGGNFRIDELQAAVLRVKLKYLDRWTQGRQRNAAFYNAAFADAHFANKLATPSVAARWQAHFQSIHRACSKARRIEGLFGETWRWYRDLLPGSSASAEVLRVFAASRRRFPGSGARGARNPGITDISGIGAGAA